MDAYVIAMAVVVSILTSANLTLLFMPIYGLLRKQFYVPFVRNKMLKEAYEKGHMVTAHLKKTYGDSTGTATGSRSVPGKFQGLYEYQYNGKTYKRYLHGYSLPQTVTLFYQNKPHKAMMASSFGMAENPTWFIQYIVLVLIVAAIIFTPIAQYVQENLQYMQEGIPYGQ